MNTFHISTKIFEDFKNGIHSKDLYTRSRCKQFQANISIFVGAMAEKPGKGDDVTFKRGFWHF